MHLIKALGAQISGWFVAILALRLVETVEPSPWGLLLMQGGFAAATAWWMRAPPWWIPIHLAFSPLIVLALRAQIAPGWYLGIFLLLAAV
ncbi:MAG: methyltransferase type 12, partial [Rhodocyclaceae bacterium]|nr:methyltransferase type 12 [Rhodocyclaceae bacterium]